VRNPDEVPDTAVLLTQQRLFLEHCLHEVDAVRAHLEALATRLAPVLIAPGHDAREIAELRTSAVDVLLALFDVGLAVMHLQVAGYEQRQLARLSGETITLPVPATLAYEQ
jgi:hypothetical protein